MIQWIKNMFSGQRQTQSIEWRTDNSIFNFLSSNIDNTTELLSVENDSIYVLATYQRFNEKHNISRPFKIKLTIGKAELLGVVVSPTIKEMKKKRRGFFLFWGTLTIIVTTLLIIGGG